MRETAFVVNPAAGSGRGGAVWSALLAAHPELAVATLIRAEDPEGAVRELDRTLALPLRRLLVVGGDGTIHLAANRLLTLNCTDRIALGVIPAGTGSDLIRHLRLPRQPAQALQRALRAEPRRMDVLRLQTGNGQVRFAVNVASAGISGLVDARVNSTPKRGRATFLLSALAAIRDYKPYRCQVLVEDRTWYQGPILLLAIANGTTFGGGMRIAPRAQIDDGLAEVVLITPISKLQALARLPQLYLGTHLNSAFVRWSRAQRLQLASQEPLSLLDVDGEVMESGFVDVEVIPRALRILA